MALVTDFRAVSENAIEQLADRFDDLPRPLLAAIGAGDLAVEQLAALRESLPRPTVLIVTGRNIDDALYNRLLSDRT